MPFEARVCLNAGTAAQNEPYGPVRESILSSAGFDAAMAEIRRWPGCSPTPLINLPEQA